MTYLNRAVGLAAAFCLAIAPAALAQPFNERTLIKVTDAMMVPGATLTPGTYVFKLVNPMTNQHTVQILTEDESKVLTTTVTVPIKRDDPKGDLVLKLNPTESGTPAMKAYFYPGSLYGHQFVYPDAEAKDIAQRTKTVVLSADVKGTDMEGATIHVYNPQGQRSEWQRDEATAREFDQWRKGQSNATAKVAAPGSGEKGGATAPMMAAGTQAMPVKLDQLEDDAKQYIGKTVSVDAEVENVLGPRIFTIDEPNWWDLEGEILVFMPSHLAALVREDDRVTVTGTVKQFVKADFEREWGWFDPDPDLLVKLGTRPVLVASRIVGGDSDVAMFIETRPESGGQATAGQQQQATGDRAVGTTGTPDASRGEALTDLQKLEQADDKHIGRNVKLNNVQIANTAKDGGFWLKSGATHIFVLPAAANVNVSSGQSVSIDGVLLQMPESMVERLKPGGEWNDAVYVYATNVSR